MSSNLVPGDQAYHEDKQLLADLTELNGQLSRYILRLLDADAQRTPPVSPAQELLVARALRAMSKRVEERADRRAEPDTPPVLENAPAHRQLTNDRPSERC